MGINFGKQPERPHYGQDEAQYLCNRTRFVDESVSFSQNAAPRGGLG